MEQKLITEQMGPTNEALDSQYHKQLEAATHAGIRRTAWTIGVLTILLVCFFDLGPVRAINDDWGFAWDVRHLDFLHFHLYPSASALALPQIVWAWVVTLGHADPRLLRLSVVPFIVLTMYTIHRLARLIGTNKTWSAIAAIAPLSFPVFTADATTFMTDAPYVALLLVATLGALHWHDGRKWITLCITFATLATLQRQTGLMLPIAITGGLLIYRRDFRLRRDGLGLAILWAGCLTAIVLPIVMGIVPPTQGIRIAEALAPNPKYILEDLLFLPGMLGLGLILFLPGLALGFKKRVKVDRNRLWVASIVLWEIMVLTRVGDTFPGNVFTATGFNASQAWLSKPPIFSWPVYFGTGIVAAMTMSLFVWRWRDWWPDQTGRSSALLLFLAVTQALPFALLHYLAFDRYYIPVIFLLIPLAARAASRTTRPILAARLALLLAVASTALYVVGEQDSQAWLLAHEKAACLAYQYASPLDVNAGYEANAVYAEVPYYERTGTILGVPLPDNNGYFSLDGPVDPVIVIENAQTNDARPGYSYSSLMPGKVVLALGTRGFGINIQVPKNALPLCSPTG